MFKISRKAAIIRAAIISVIVAAITATGLYFSNKTDESNAITPEGKPITIEVDDWIYYDGAKFTGNYYLYLDGVRVTAFCAQPALDNPTGPNYAYSLPNTDPDVNLIKLVMFLLFNDNARTSAARTAFYAPFSTEYSLQYAWTHAIIGAIYADDYTGLSPENVVKVENAITTLENYYNTNSDLWLMAKNYQVFRAKGVDGVTQDVVWLEDNTQYGTINVQKCDSEGPTSGACAPQGAASLEGIEFTVYNNSGRYYNKSNDTFYNNGDQIARGSTNASGQVSFANLPANNITYRVKETATNSTYQLTAAEQNVTLNGSGNVQNPRFYNVVNQGSITVHKTDDRVGCGSVGDSNLFGAEFKLINRTGNTIVYQGRSISNGGDVVTKSLSATCEVVFDNLPYGKYAVQETKAGNGYVPDTTPREVTIPTGGNVNLTVDFVNSPFYGDLTINKKDAETQECTAVKHLSFIGTTYQVINRSNNPVYYNNVSIPVGSVITTVSFTSDPCNGGLKVGPLPYGTYEIKETSVSEGYVLNTTSNTVKIADSNIHPETTIVNQAKRGDVTFIKTDPNNDRPMSDVIFTISRINDDDVLEETHIVVTDENGVIDTRSSFNLHSYQTNRYDVLYEEPDPLQYGGFGTWYGYDNLNRPLPVNDSLGALPYGRYVIQELRCGANLFCYEVINQKATITISQDNQVVDLGNWDNNCAKLSMDTEAVDAEDDDKFIEIKEDTNSAQILDKIDFCVKPKFKVTIKGVLMDKQTGEPLVINGQTVENSVDVMLEEGEECGSTVMAFDIPDISALGGHELVTFQTMWYRDDVVLRHEKIDDDSQTVEVVSLTTYATNKDTNDKFLPYDQQTTVKDIVKYCVKPGLEYTIKGIVMNKETESPLLINGETVEQEVTFTPEKACGELEMFYDIDTTGLSGARLVIFESLYRDDELIIEHKNFNNPDESFEVEIPAPETGVFTDAASGKSSSTFNIALVIFVASTAGITVYGVSRVCARKSFLKRK